MSRDERSKFHKLMEAVGAPPKGIAATQEGTPKSRGVRL